MMKYADRFYREREPDITPAPTSPDRADPSRLAVYIDHLTLRMIERKVGIGTYKACRFVEAAIREKLERKEHGKKNI